MLSGRISASGAEPRPAVKARRIDVRLVAQLKRQLAEIGAIAWLAATPK